MTATDTHSAAAEQRPAAAAGQLTQVRVPLDNAAMAFTCRDTGGRLPIVLIPQRTSRIQTELLGMALVILLAGLIGAGAIDLPWLLPLAATLTVVLVVLAVFRAFIVQIPEGVSALLARGGRYTRTLGSGVHFVLPFITVSHLITRREIPYDVPVGEALTRDNVRAVVDTLLTFSITEPHKFVYNISADDLDTVLQAACQDALRTLVRGVLAAEVVDLQRADIAPVHKQISSDVAAYGVTVHKLLVTYARPPAEVLRAQEAQQLAVVERATQAERQLLAIQRQQGAAALARQQVADESANEALRLEQLQERVLRFPEAAQYDLGRARLEVARALAANARTLLRVDSLDELALAALAADAPRERGPSQNGAREHEA